MKACALLMCLSLGIASAMSSGCATIMSGDFQEVSFDSSPSGVEIYKDGNKSCVTPCSVTLRRTYHITLQNKTAVPTPPLVLVAKKDGYEDQKVSLPVEMNSWMWVDVILSTGLIGTTSLAVDAYTPAGGQYESDKYFVTMIPLKASQTEQVRLAKTSRLRYFVLRSYADLQSDLAQGRGEYLESLNVLLDPTEGKADTSLAELRRLSLRHQTRLGFADAIVERFYGE